MYVENAILTSNKSERYIITCSKEVNLNYL